MDEINGADSLPTQIECPACLAEGVVTESGYASKLVYMPSMDPPYRCLAAHGGLSVEVLMVAGIDERLLRRPPTGDTAHGSTELTEDLPGVDEESRERWEDESPSSTAYRDHGS